MKFIFIADFFADEILGGGELNNNEVIHLLRNQGYEVLTVKSDQVTSDFIQQYSSHNFIVGNFTRLIEQAKTELLNCKYTIYEHDHKYLSNRNPAVFTNFVAPKESIVNYEFYKNAMAVFCQSSFHASIVRKNLDLDNIVSLGGNLWSEESLKLLSTLVNIKKNNIASILDSDIEHKNTIDAIRYCKTKNIQYELVKSNIYESFLRRLGANNFFVFFPKTPETLSRVIVEARMMGMSITTNNLVGASKEDWFRLKGEELISVFWDKRTEIPNTVIEAYVQ